MDTTRDYYKVLGVDPDATEAELKSAYRRLALRHHPDRNPGDASAEERFKEASEAYAILSDPFFRARYDQRRGVARGADRRAASPSKPGKRAAAPGPPAEETPADVEREGVFARNRELLVEMQRLHVLDELYAEAVRDAGRLEIVCFAVLALTVAHAAYHMRDPEFVFHGISSPLSWIWLFVLSLPLAATAGCGYAIVRRSRAKRAHRRLKRKRTELAHKLAGMAIRERWSAGART